MESALATISPPMPKPHSTFTLSPVARYLVKTAAEQDGETRTRYVEQLIRKDAKRRGIEIPPTAALEPRPVPKKKRPH